MALPVDLVSALSRSNVAVAMETSESDPDLNRLAVVLIVPCSQSVSLEETILDLLVALVVVEIS